MAVNLKLAKGDSVLVEGMMEYSSYQIKKKAEIELPIEIDIPTAKIKAANVQLLRRATKTEAVPTPVSKSNKSNKTGIPANKDQEF